MTAPAPTKCRHCNSIPVSKTIPPHPAVPGAKHVVLSLCRCDYLICKRCDRAQADRYSRTCVCGATV